MKFFEIIFILLILLPFALLMRFFVSKLSAQTPMQRRSAPEDVKPRKKRKPAKINLRRKKRNKDIESNEAYEGSRAESASRQSTPYRDQDSMYGRRPEPYRDQDTPRSNAVPSESSTRRHTELKRTQRIPFSELYGSMPAQTAQTYQAPQASQASQTSVSDSVQKRISDRRAATKNAPRSEQEPSKRQKRRNRERARKRELARRDKDNKE